MSTTWNLVINRAGAAIYETTSPMKKMRFIMSVDHPEGRFRDQDMVSDKAGRTLNRATGQRTSYEPPQTAREHEAGVFASKIAAMLDEGLKGKKYEKLVLVAEPRMLGIIKDALSSHALEKVVRVIEKDLVQSSLDEIQEAVR